MGTLFSTQKEDIHAKKLEVEKEDAAGLRESKMESSSSIQEICGMEGLSRSQTVTRTVKEKDTDTQTELRRSFVVADAAGGMQTGELEVEKVDAAVLRESKMESSSSIQEICEMEGLSSRQTDTRTVKEKDTDTQTELRRSFVVADAAGGIQTGEEEKEEEREEKENGGVTETETESGTSRSSVEEDAAVKLQKVYRSYRTRRNLADCAVVAEELWDYTKPVSGLIAHGMQRAFHDDPSLMSGESLQPLLQINSLMSNSYRPISFE